MSENFKRIAKNIVILLLLVSAVFLTWLNWFSTPPKIAGDTHSSFARFVNTIIGRKDVNNVSDTYNEYQEYAYTSSIVYPSQIVLKNGDDIYLYTEHEQIEEFFERIKLSLSAALSTAQKRYAVNSAQWRSTLGKSMIFMSFSGDMPLYYMSAVLGVPQTDKMDNDINSLILDFSGETVVLYTKTPDGEMYTYETGLRSVNVDTLYMGKETEGVFFACQNMYTSNRVPDETVLIDTAVKAPVLNVSTAIPDFSGTGAERMINDILSSFGFNPYSTNSYIESDATRVYVEQLKTIRIAPDGTVIYDSGSQNDLKPMNLMEMSAKTQIINHSAQIAERSIIPNIGVASAYILRQYSDTDSGNYIVAFSARYNDMKIDLPGGYLARFEYRGTELVKAYVNLRAFTVSDETDMLLPGVYAAAALGVAEANGFEVRYTIKNKTASAEWFCY